MNTARIEFAAFTDAGPVRERNEDRWIAEPASGLFAVIDGMGGHAGGEAAAEIARSSLTQTASPSDGFMLANRRIHDAVQSDPSLAGMGCVVTAATVNAGMLQVTHVGDTLAILITRAGAEVLTARHTRAGALQAAHGLDDREAAALGVSNQLLRDVGGALRTDRQWFDVSERMSVEPGALLLLCSDGVHGPLSHSDLVTALREAHASFLPLDELVRALVRLALDRGGRDNATAVAVRWLPTEAATRPVPAEVDGQPERAAPHAADPHRVQATPSQPAASPPPLGRPTTSTAARTIGTLMIGVLLGVLLSAWAVCSSESSAPDPDDLRPAAPSSPRPVSPPSGSSTSRVSSPPPPHGTPPSAPAPVVPPSTRPESPHDGPGDRLPTTAPVKAAIPEGRDETDAIPVLPTPTPPATSEAPNPPASPPRAKATPPEAPDGAGDR